MVIRFGGNRTISSLDVAALVLFVEEFLFTLPNRSCFQASPGSPGDLVDAAFDDILLC